MINQETLKTFDDLYYETYNDILKYVVCNCSNIEDVRDIVQNIYLDVLKKLRKSNCLVITKQYIMGIARHKIKDYYRFNYKSKIVSLFWGEKDTLLIDTIPSDYNLQDDFIKEEDLKIVWDFLKKKKIIISKVFYLYYYVGYDIKGISKELSITEANVKNYLYRTLKELRVLLNVGGDDNV